MSNLNNEVYRAINMLLDRMAHDGAREAGASLQELCHEAATLAGWWVPFSIRSALLSRRLMMRDELTIPICNVL